MAAKIQFRRGLNADRTGVVFDAGEPAWASDTKQLWVGDGSTAGGKQVAMWGDSPSFNGLTSTDTIWATNGTVQAILSFGATTGNIGTNSAHALALITGGSQRVNIGTDGVATFYGAAPGTPGAGEVRVGNGEMKTAGAATIGGSVFMGTLSVPSLRQRNFGYAGYSATVLGSEVSGVLSNLCLGVDPSAVAGGSFGGTGNEIFLRRGVTLMQPNAGATDWEKANLTLGTMTCHGPVVLEGSNQYIQINEATVGKWYVQWLNTTASADYYSATYHRIFGTTAPGTPGANYVLIGAGQVACPSGQGLYIGGAARFTGDASYSHVRSPSGAVKMYVANGSTYYDNDEHNFRNAAGTSQGPISCGAITTTGSIYGSSSTAMYFGDANTDGSWAIYRDGNDLVIARRQSGAWAEASRLIPPV